jgi:hypothetical protein
MVRENGVSNAKASICHSEDPDPLSFKTGFSLPKEYLDTTCQRFGGFMKPVRV